MQQELWNRSVVDPASISAADQSQASKWSRPVWQAKPMRWALRSSPGGCHMQICYGVARCHVSFPLSVAAIDAA